MGTSKRGLLKGVCGPHDSRDRIVDYMKSWTERSDLPCKDLLKWAKSPTCNPSVVEPKVGMRSGPIRRSANFHVDFGLCEKPSPHDPENPQTGYVYTALPQRGKFHLPINRRRLLVLCKKSRAIEFIWRSGTVSQHTRLREYPPIFRRKKLVH